MVDVDVGHHQRADLVHGEFDVNRLAPAPSGEVSAPWNRPQSTSTDCPSGSVSWWQEPVTPSTAPWWQWHCLRRCRDWIAASLRSSQ
jgi:hypothetical protein